MIQPGPSAAPTPGGPPGGPPGAPPGMGAGPQPPAPPVPVPQPAPKPAAPPSPPLIDLASALPSGIQLMDYATRFLRRSAATLELVRNPVERAALLSVIEDIEKIMAAVSSEGRVSGAPVPMASSEDTDESGEAPEGGEED